MQFCSLQDMLARTQALEDRLLSLNAEKNELEAESARMPSHTTGRTLQVRNVECINELMICRQRAYVYSTRCVVGRKIGGLCS